MRKHVFLVLLVAGLAGCASIAPYGNFATNSPAGLDEKIAADTVKQLVILYPPASTRFNLGQPTPDAYGAALVGSLRTQGYALLEFKPESTTNATNVAAVPGLSLGYVLDTLAGMNLYRVTVMVGSKSLTRVYVAQNDTAAPAGAWVRKE